MPRVSEPRTAVTAGALPSQRRWNDVPRVNHNPPFGLDLCASRRYTEVNGRPCVAADHCPDEPIQGAPVRLCSKHLREVYEFASDLVTERWDAGVREYVSGLHDTFKPPRVVRQPKSGWVYFVKFGDRIKVGYSTDPRKRLSSVPHDERIGCVPGTLEDEAAWHDLLRDFRITGEWFRAEPEVLATIRRVVRNGQ